MQSFRTELENPIVEKDIIDLEKKIRAFQEGKIHDEKFRSLRLARGIYGQRQPGVQMIRIKLPFGKVTFKQILKIADVSDEYASSNLHLTTRQDIQIHYVSLDRTPELWSKLEQDDITLREACGNTVRNVTASPSAGIEKNEPFDVSPYAHAYFKYFLRNPICQEMGRKIKFAFSSSEADSAFSFIHDLGFIPKVKHENGEEIRGFKVVLGGGLGAQPSLAHVVHEFLHEDLIIPYGEAMLRVFDRHGERTNRNKARLKFLVNKLGIDELVRLIEEEQVANKVKTFKIDRDAIELPQLPTAQIISAQIPDDKQLAYQLWLNTNTFEQKQEGYFGVYVKVKTGDIPTNQARKFIAAIKDLVADEIRVTINQGLLLKFVKPEALPNLFLALDELDLAAPGFDSVADVTTCPGTDTCNLGISNSMELSRVLEQLVYDEYADFVENKEIKIKISGCMNSCGQHGLAHIGFHGSSMKVGGRVMPAVQVLLGGGIVGNGVGRAADKVVKVPSKRATHVLRAILDDYRIKGAAYPTFHSYYDDLGKDYFYQLLKPIADQSTLVDSEFIDWGHEETFQTAIGVGECAGVVIDLVATLVYEAEEKFSWATEAFENNAYADAIFHAYNTMVSGAKALLLDKGINQSTQIGVINAFDENYAATFNITSFNNMVLQINKNEPSEEFATAYLAQANDFLIKVKNYRETLNWLNNFSSYYLAPSLKMDLFKDKTDLLNNEVDNGNELFPIFLKLQNFQTLLVGGGNVGLEKLNAMLVNSPQAKITIVADRFLDEVKTLVNQYPAVNIIERKFEDRDLDGAELVILATDNKELHQYIRTLAKEKGILVNVADTPDLCDFYLGSIVKKGNLKIAISTNGKSPTVAKRIKEVLNEGIPEEINDTLDQINKLRETLTGDFANKIKVLNQATASLVNEKQKEPTISAKALSWLIWSIVLVFTAVIFYVIWQQEPAFREYVETINPTFYWFLIAGFVFAMIDGAIGMSYGVTSTTFSLSMGIPPASASMAVHISEILSNGIAGWMHFKMGNVNKKLFKLLVIPGIIGAVTGAYILSSLEEYSHYTKPLISIYTLVLGFVILKKAIGINKKKVRSSKKITSIKPLGFFGGFIDAVGGGGWGSIVLSSLIAGGRNARYSLGSVKLSRFFIALMSSLTFVTMLNDLQWYAVAGLVIGSAIASPIAAKVSNRISAKTIMVSVGFIVIAVSIRSIIKFVFF